VTLRQVPQVTDEIPICEAEHLHTFSATKIRSTEIKAMLLCVVYMFKPGHCNHVFTVSLPCAQSHLLPAHKVDVDRVSLTYEYGVVIFILPVIKVATTFVAHFTSVQLGPKIHSFAKL
jgi:hypothetical protein